MKWQGISGEKPSQDQYKSALSDHDLFLYVFLMLIVLIMTIDSYCFKYLDDVDSV